MRNTFIRILLALILLLALSGCGETDRLVGRWEGIIPVNDRLKEAIAAHGMIDDADLEGVTDITLRYTFEKDGTYTIEVSQSSLPTEDSESDQNPILDHLKDYATVRVDDEVLESWVGEHAVSGRWETEMSWGDNGAGDGMLYVTRNKEKTIKEGVDLTYHINFVPGEDGDKLLLNDVQYNNLTYYDDLARGANELIYPLTLQKVK